MTPLEKKLANALYQTWSVLPFDLSRIPTDYADREEGSKAIEKAHDKAKQALARAEGSGWRLPK